MKTEYLIASCGKRIPGYGFANAEKNLSEHKKICDKCNATVITETVKPSNPKIINDKPVLKEMDLNKEHDKKEKSLSEKVLGSKKGKGKKK